MYGGAESHDTITKTGNYFKNGETYDIAFGMYDVSATSVRIVLKVNGIALFDEEVQDSAYVSADAYFCVVAGKGGVEVVLGEETVTAPIEGNLVNVGTLIGDEANWKSINTTPQFSEGTLSITGTDDSNWGVIGYAKENYADAVYQFTYTHELDQTTTADSFTGIILDLDEGCGPEYYFNGLKVYVLMSKTGTYLYYRGGDETHGESVDGKFVFEDGKIYEIVFGMYDVSETAVRVIMTVDGEVVFDEEVQEPKYVGAKSYFCVTAMRGGTATATIGGVAGTEPNPEPTMKEPTKVSVGTLLEDTANWKGLNATPAFAKDGTLTVISTAETAQSAIGYAGQKYANAVYQFSYTQMLDDNNYSMGGFFLDLDGTCEPQNHFTGMAAYGKIYVLVENDGDVYLYYYDTASGKSKSVGTAIKFEDKKTYDIEFGMYDMSENSVRIVMNVDGEEAFNVELSDENYVERESYFCVLAQKNGLATVKINGYGVDPVEDPEPTMVPVGTMLETENQGKWQGLNATPAFETDGTLTVASTNANNSATVKYGEKYANAVYQFSYEQSFIETTNYCMGGFFLDLTGGSDPIYYFKGLDATCGNIRVLIENGRTPVLKYYDSVAGAVKTKESTFAFEDNKKYNIKFGMYDISGTTVCIVMTVDGVEVFNVEVADAKYVGKESYFCVTAQKNNMATVKVGAVTTK